jgi:photosynthetic reaction center cytochrome c subunit
VVAAEEEPATPAYVNYWIGSGYVTDEATAAVQAYIQEYPEPQNVQVLVGLTTTQVWGYMTQQVAGGMQVNCTYCHALANFGAETLEEYEALYEPDPGSEITAEQAWTNKTTARTMLQLTADLNQNWLTQLGEYPNGFGDDRFGVAEQNPKQPGGYQITCATCHYGEPQFETWPTDHAVLAHPIDRSKDYRLPLRAADGSVGTVDDINAALVMTGNDDEYSLDAVQYNQLTMYHMMDSLAVGCTHCHNSRYFPSWEQPAKYYAYVMLQMNQHILREYEDVLNGKEPSCVMCHQNNAIPPGAAINASILPDPLASDYAPGK